MPKKSASAASPASASSSGEASKAKISSSSTTTTSATSKVKPVGKTLGRRLAFAYGLVGFSIVVGVLSVVLKTESVSSTLKSVLEWLNFIEKECKDYHASCAFWAGEGECKANPDYMTRICQKSCGTCNVRLDEDEDEGKKTRRQSKEEDDEEDKQGEAVVNAAVKEDTQGGDTDEYGDNDDDDDDDEEEEESGGSPTPRMLVDDSADCEDKDTECPMWAEEGECEANPDYMLENCRLSCKVCTVVNNKQQRERGDGDCSDESPDCPEFAARGECDANPDWMLENCRKSCKVCGEAALTACNDRHKDCKFWASIGECDANPNYMLEHCRKSCNVCDADEVEEITPDEEEGVENEGDSKTTVEDDDAAQKRIDCKDKHPKAECEQRKKRGECEANPGWTIVFCGKTCGRCDLLSQKARCVPEVFNDTNYRYVNALEKGDLNKLFESIVRDNPTTTEVLLRPPQGPWVLRFPDFVTDLERDTILDLTLPNVRRSTDQGAFNEEGVQEQVVSSGRTSSNAWCMDECESHPVVQNLTQRISDLVRVPTVNFESFQVLQYKKDQKYDVHHDASDEERDDMAGPRILTFFIYFSDVEEGGETSFNKLGLKVKPKRGSAILWPSVLDEDPSKVDWRTTHAALPVIKGEKLAANVWIHLRDFATPNLWGCTGAFDE